MFYLFLSIIMITSTFISASDQNCPNTPELTTNMKEIIALYREDITRAGQLARCKERVQLKNKTYTDCLAEFCDSIKENKNSRLSYDDFKELCDNTQDPERLTDGLLYLFEQANNFLLLRAQKELALLYAKKTEQLQVHEPDNYHSLSPSITRELTRQQYIQVEQIDKDMTKKNVEIREHIKQTCPELLPFWPS